MVWSLKFGSLFSDVIVRYFTRLLVSPNILHRTVTKRAGSPSTARTILLSLSRIQLHEADEQRRFLNIKQDSKNNLQHKAQDLHTIYKFTFEPGFLVVTASRTKY